LDETKALRTDFLKLGKDINGGLQSVSGTGLQLSSIGKSLESGLLEMQYLRKAVAALPQVASPIALNADAQS
jgi:hypothetical protein